MMRFVAENDRENWKTCGEVEVDPSKECSVYLANTLPVYTAFLKYFIYSENKEKLYLLFIVYLIVILFIALFIKS